MTPLFRVGVIGAGHAARNAHLPGWAAVPGASIVALCDPDPSALETTLRALAASRIPQPSASAISPRTFTSHHALLAEDLDAVSICAPNAAHFPLARDALRAGKHVFCEKPLCISAAEARALGGEADARGLVLMARHQLRFDAAALHARARVRAGDLGTVHHMRVRALRRDRIPTVPGLIDKELAGGGAALDLGMHALDMAVWLAGMPAGFSRAARVTGSVRAVFGNGDGSIRNYWGEWDRARFSVEDFAAGFVHFANGATLALECAWAGHYDAAEEGLGCALFGDKGSLHWPAGKFVSVGTAVHAEPPNLGATAEDAVPQLNAPDFKAFHVAVLAGGPSPVPWREAAASIEILEALYLSAREGREILL
jgi:predicted dehydrogenase